MEEDSTAPLHRNGFDRQGRQLWREKKLPLTHVSLEFNEEVKRAAAEAGVTKREFVLDAVRAKMGLD